MEPILPPDFQKPSKVLNIALVIYFFLSLLLFMVLLFVSWPDTSGDVDSFFYNMSLDKRLLIFAFSAAAIGSILGTLRYFMVLFNKQIGGGWAVFYFFNPIIGMIIGAFVYIAIRGGVLKASSEVDVLNPYAIASIAAIAGFLSEQIINSLKRFGNKLSSENRDPEANKLN